MKLKRLLLLSCLSLATTGNMLSAASIELENPGFELPASGKIIGFDAATDVPGWNDISPVTDCGVEPTPGWQTKSGDYAAFLINQTDTTDRGIYQMTGHTITPGEMYKVGFWLNNIYAGTEVTVTLFADTPDSAADALGSYTATGLNGTEYIYFETVISATPESVDKELGIQFSNTNTTTVPNWIGLDDITLEMSYADYVTNHDPADGETDISVDLENSTIANNLSWSAPNDPNIAVIKGYDLYLDPNMTKVENRDSNCLIVASTSANATQYNPVNNFEYSTSYYWAVDTKYTKDDDPALGTSNETINVGSSAAWSFETISATPVIITYDSVITSLELLPATLNAVITDADNDLTSVEFTLLTNDADFPSGADAYLQNKDDSDLYAPSIQLVADLAGTYKIRITATDSSGNSSDRIAGVDIYSDTCQASQQAPSWAGFNAMDFNTDCVVNVFDFAILAAQWLDDRNIDVEEYFSATQGYTPIVNGIVNGDFETGEVSTGTYWWVSNGVAITDQDPIEGSYSVEWTVDAGDGLVAYMTVEADTSYKFSVQISGGAAGENDELLVRYGDATILAQADWSPLPSIQTVTIPFTTSANDEGARLEFVIYGNSDGAYYKIDDLRLTKITQ